MVAPEPLAAIYILGMCVYCIFCVTALMLITCRMVNLSINHGNATWSPMSYANYGLVLCGVVQDIELGYKFAIGSQIGRTIEYQKVTLKH